MSSPLQQRLTDAHARNRELALSVGNARALLAQHGFQQTPEDALDVMVARAVDAARYPAQVGWEDERQSVRTLHKWAMQAADRGDLYAGLVFETRALYAAHALGEQVSVPTRYILAKSVRGFAAAIMAMEEGTPVSTISEPSVAPAGVDEAAKEDPVNLRSVAQWVLKLYDNEHASWDEIDTAMNTLREVLADPSHGTPHAASEDGTGTLDATGGRGD